MTRIGIDTTTYILHRENIYYCLTCTLVEKTIICKEKIALKVIRLLRDFFAILKMRRTRLEICSFLIDLKTTMIASKISVM